MITEENKPLTRRQKYTISAMHEAYLDLLEHFPESKIRIVDLCEQADINRATFYRYYPDMDAFRQDVRASFFSQLFSVLSFPEAETQQSRLTPREHNPLSAQARIMKALNAVQKNRRLCKLLITMDDASIIERQLEEHLPVYWDVLLSAGCSEDVAALYYGYLCGGMAQVLVHWIRSDFSTPKEKVAAIIEHIIHNFYGLVTGDYQHSSLNGAIQ